MFRYKHDITTSIFALFLIFPFILLGQGNSDKSGTTAAQFLKIGVGAKPMAMAGAYAGHSDAIYSLYWNPAGLTKIKNITLGVVHTNWFADISHQFLGFSLPLGANSVVGLHGIFLSMDPIQITTIDQPHGTSEFYEASDLALGISFSTRPVDFLSLGITSKLIHQAIHNESASTFAFDVGSLLDIPYRGIKLGMHFSNFGGKMKLDGRDLTREFDLNPDNTLNTGVETRLVTQGWDLPVNFRVGLAMDLMGRGDVFAASENNRLTLTVDGNHPSDAAEHLNFGMEYAFNETIMLRGGYRVNRDLEKFFYGFGLNVPLSGASAFRFDYALASFGELDYVHIFGGSISL